MSFGGDEQALMKGLFAEDNQEGSDKTHAAERLSYLRIQAEIMWATDEAFRAIWEPYRSGLTSNVTDLNRELRLIRETFHNGEEISDADLCKQHDCPFLDANEYIKQTAAGATVDTKQLRPEQIRKYFHRFGHSANIQTFHPVAKSIYSFQTVTVSLTLSQDSRPFVCAC